MKLPLNNLNYPVKILIGKSCGSGFLISYKNNVYLVTAKHVVYQKNNVSGDFELYDNKLNIICHTFLQQQLQHLPRKYELDLEKLIENNNLIYHETEDIIIFKLGSLNKELVINFELGISIVQDADGSIVHYGLDNSRKFEDTEITNDVFVLGYPVSLGITNSNQISYDHPLVRKGIIAGKNYKNKTIILDCPVYGGNSGGMVLEINSNNIHLIGVVVEFVPFVDTWQNVHFAGLMNSNFQNSGYSVAIPVDYIYDLIEKIK